jgi:hypothetical protein
MCYLVGEVGFEPTRGIAPADFKSASSAGSDTRPGNTFRVAAADSLPRIA